MALATDCQTPGAQYGCHISQDHIKAWVELPFALRVNASEAEQLEARTGACARSLLPGCGVT